MKIRRDHRLSTHQRTRRDASQNERVLSYLIVRIASAKAYLASVRSVQCATVIDIDAARDDRYESVVCLPHCFCDV